MAGLVIALLALGFIFHLLGAIGLHRFPDAYARAHAGTLCTTFGAMGIIFGVILYAIANGLFSLGLHSFLALIFLFIGSATGSHAITRAAYKSGLKPKLAFDDALAKVKE
ncbi:MAG: monovalent cation/H(+) antiporter subunit G [Candidatus Diapherotrites archaeon]|nr:monovalent cation/H(+) antiporter subunit G [Candidatus Diapherotrites archaeon]